jgi:hypothetical protein
MDAPPGVTLEDASEIVSRDQLFEAEGGFAAFSDLFRYELILKHGEWWVDADVYCLRDDIPDCDYAWAHQDRDRINGAILKFPANDENLDRISKAAKERSKITTDWCELGPAILTEFIETSRFDSHFGTTNTFYPIHWVESFLFWLPNCNGVVIGKGRASYFVHLWSSVLNKIGVDRNTKPPQGSFLRNICEPYFDNFTSLHDINLEKYKAVIEAMKSYFAQDWVPSWSMRQVGYDVSKFDFDGYLDRVFIRTQQA